MAEVMSRHDVHGCVPAHQRLGPFGHSNGRYAYGKHPWDSVNWGVLQRDCAQVHHDTHEAQEPPPSKLRRTFAGLDSELNASDQDDRITGRTAVVLRTWDQYDYNDDQKAWLRAMTTELALDTGGRFQVFLLVDVKDSSLDLRDDDVYAAVLERSVPREFQDMSLLFNEDLLREWYPKVGKYDAQDQMYQALQIFSFTFPEFDYVWQLEMDARFTGNVADMLESAVAWATDQPRKNLWERNSRWYVSGLWSGYATFSAAVDNELRSRHTIWGPPPGADQYIKPQGPTPPSRSDSSWGIGEPADLITFSPIIDPVGTNWTYEDTVYGFDPPADLPRRMAIVSMTRTSRRLLRLISAEQRATGAWVVSESTPETWSFLHGLKAVYVPHLVSLNLGEEVKTPQELDAIIHKGPIENRAGGEETGFLWQAYIGGIPEPKWLTASYFYWAGDAPRLWWEYTNGVCTYPLLLHPVKNG